MKLIYFCYETILYFFVLNIIINTEQKLSVKLDKAKSYEKF